MRQDNSRLIPKPLSDGGTSIAKHFQILGVSRTVSISSDHRPWCVAINVVRSDRRLLRTGRAPSGSRVRSEIVLREQPIGVQHVVAACPARQNCLTNTFGAIRGDDTYHEDDTRITGDGCDYWCRGRDDVCTGHQTPSAASQASWRCENCLHLGSRQYRSLPDDQFPFRGRTAAGDGCACRQRDRHFCSDRISEARGGMVLARDS